MVYTWVNGQLFSNETSSAKQFGTSLGVAYSPFIPQTSPGSIRNTFTVDSQSNLIWNNGSLYNNFAQWCVRSDNSITAVFVALSLAPDDCIFVQLSLVRCE